ncbi:MULTISPECIES: precorrin-8X methylmutase [Synechocystis]|uniref:Precorrin-8X methylmutase n=1 Tax=Synechocystis salina LEGE 00031 TaxID=1828736 RepID=A0ABR9VT37_9SYNC|nr:MULTISPECIES: precorrin-8X methylmutase [Synechocystis]MBE9193944.1 precorrin-8X methylmutase [Synechocystis sp. LEGE 06083]MBE9242027.1 precorrin-8X methylmutase [Synechocystis salina LEGE 00041]MBE9254519.1 precorrin-8X methylmutase [Synechocystis salina LEGE 00031]
MNWHISDAQNLATIDYEVEDHGHSPAQYEILRRVIYATGDFEYLNLLHFSPRVLTIGAAALASRTTILVDVPMVQVGIVPTLQKTFANPVYCATQSITRPQKERTEEAWGIFNLAHRYPDGIFVIGHGQTALDALMELVAAQRIQPALVIATATNFGDRRDVELNLQEANIPHITVQGRKGGAEVAAAIITALVDLAWQAYEQRAHLN